MSTRSTISYIREDGFIATIYCHLDGYPRHNGKILNNYYKSYEKVSRLIECGGISSLNVLVNPPKGYRHSFDDRCPLTTTFYCRDRGEDWKDNEPTISADLLRYAVNIKEVYEEYNYMFMDGQWYLYDLDKEEFVELDSMEECSEEDLWEMFKYEMDKFHYQDDMDGCIAALLNELM